jgi:hypothetical protein
MAPRQFTRSNAPAAAPPLHELGRFADIRAEDGAAHQELSRHRPHRCCRPIESQRGSVQEARQRDVTDEASTSPAAREPLRGRRDRPHALLERLAARGCHPVRGRMARSSAGCFRTESVSLARRRLASRPPGGFHVLPGRPIELARTRGAAHHALGPAGWPGDRLPASAAPVVDPGHLVTATCRGRIGHLAPPRPPRHSSQGARGRSVKARPEASTRPGPARWGKCPGRTAAGTCTRRRGASRPHGRRRAAGTHVPRDRPAAALSAHPLASSAPSYRPSFPLLAAGTRGSGSGPSPARRSSGMRTGESRHPRKRRAKQHQGQLGPPGR